MGSIEMEQSKPRELHITVRMPNLRTFLAFVSMFAVGLATGWFAWHTPDVPSGAHAFALLLQRDTVRVENGATSIDTLTLRTLKDGQVFVLTPGQGAAFPKEEFALWKK